MAEKGLSFDEELVVMSTTNIAQHEASTISQIPMTEVEGFETVLDRQAVISVVNT